MSNDTWPTFLALGDSYTIGEGVPPEERWPAQLAQQQSLSSPEYLAETGWTTQDLLKAIRVTHFSSRYDWVSVLIGVNDQYDGLGEQVFREGLTRIIDFALAKVAHSERVIVISIPDYSVTPFAQDRNPSRIAHEVAQFNAISRETALAKQVSYGNITLLSLRAAHDRSLLTKDGLHPSGRMYQQWADKIGQEVIRP